MLVWGGTPTSAPSLARYNPATNQWQAGPFVEPAPRTGHSAVWSGAGVALGLLLGIAVSAVLVHVVNPQSFHWTMEMLLPWGRLALLCAAMAAAGTLTAWWAGRAAGSRQAALAVKENW